MSDLEWAAIAAADVYVQFWAPADSARLERLGEKMSDEGADGWFDPWYKLARSTGLRGGRMAMSWVTDSRVRRWGVSKQGWMRSLLRACLADPEEIANRGKRLASAFHGPRKVRITHSNGTDLELALAGATPRIYEGYPHPDYRTYSEFDLMANFPEGRLRMALGAKPAEGSIFSNRRTYDEVWFPWATYTGGRFDLSHGKLISFSFQEGEAKFASDYARATPGRDRTGSLIIGLNSKINDVPHMEDKELGSVELTVGGTTYSGGGNPSDFRGAISLAGSEISIDGEPVVRAGKIL